MVNKPISEAKKVCNNHGKNLPNNNFRLSDLNIDQHQYVTDARLFLFCTYCTNVYLMMLMFDATEI